MAWQTSLTGRGSGLPTTRDLSPGDHRSSSELARSRLHSLGPVGSCFALYLASRLDLLTAPEAHELAHTSAQPEDIPPADLEALFREDLGMSIGEAFSAFDRSPCDSSFAFQWHRARLHTGEAAIFKVIRPRLPGQLDDGIDQIVAMRRFLTELCGRDVDGAISDFRQYLETSLDLQREAADLARLAEESETIALLTVPQVASDLSGPRCLTVLALDGWTAAEHVATPIDKARQTHERFARRLARVWLATTFAGSLFPENPSGRNILFLDDGRIAFCGGPFHAPAWGSQNHLHQYLTAVSVGENKQACSALLELTEKRSETDNRRLRHQLRHIAPFRDGKWDPDTDHLSRSVFAHWHRMSAIGFQPHPTLMAFLRGLATLTPETRLLAPTGSTLREAFQEYRLRRFLTEFSDLADREQWAEYLRRQARFLSELPRKLDRVLSLSGERETKAPPPAKTKERRGGWMMVGGLLAAMAATALLVHRFAEAYEWTEPIGALLVLGFGVLGLRSAGGS